jgi:flavin reductase (DIM6/NTAB) family NADH-FMN oxidoreductase RutF
MEKIKMGPKPFLYPMPVFFVGANKCGKPNFTTVAWGCVVCARPPLIAVSLRHYRHSYKGIKENGTFSINIPSAEQVVETDYCGLVSGAKSDKVRACKFEVFYGSLKTAPLIMECPVNIECSVFQIDSLGSHALVIGEVVECFITEKCMTDGRPDLKTIRPFIYAESDYVAFGSVLGAAFKIGKKLKTG